MDVNRAVTAKTGVATLAVLVLLLVFAAPLWAESSDSASESEARGSESESETRAGEAEEHADAPPSERAPGDATAEEHTSDSENRSDAEREPGEPEVVLAVEAVTANGRVVTINGGLHDGIVDGMRFEIRRGRQAIAEVEVFWPIATRASAEVVSGTQRERIEVGDTAVLISEFPEPPQPQQGTRPRREGTSRRPGAADTQEAGELRRLVSDLQNEVFRLSHRTQKLKQERDEARGQRIVLESQLDTALETSKELRRQLDSTHARLQRDVSFGLGGRAGATFGTPMFGSFGLGHERFAFEGRATVDIFAPGPIEGFRLGVLLQEQPGRGPGGTSTTLRTSVFTEVYFPDPFGGLHTGLALRYAHHHFPDPFRGHSDSGELSISWGKRVPMTQQREANSFWRYAFQPLFELVHAPYGATGTDLRMGLGFPDLIEVWVNFNWHYFTDYGRFGAVLVRARVPLLQDHGHLGSAKLILAGDYTYPLDSTMYEHTYRVGLHFEATLGR